MATVAPIEDIEAWSQKLSLWRQDCLRRLAISDELIDADLDDLLAMIKHTAGFKLDNPPPTPVPFEKDYFGSTKPQPIVLKGITKVQNVNRLVPNASLAFCPKALTIIYGRNGSGKSGFVRIMRTACRTRIENPAKLEVLRDVYGGSDGPQTAEIIIDEGTGDTPIIWTSGNTALPQLSQVSVFDTPSAQLYVDGGNQIRYLPFGLALPHRLNTVCLVLKEKLEAERETVVGDKVSLTAVAFSQQRDTEAQSFNKALSKDTTDSEIDEAAYFGEEDQARLDEVSNFLSAGAAAAADLAALVTWLEAITSECEVAVAALSDTPLVGLTTLKNKAVATRQAAKLAAGELFTDEPLPGVGSHSWRALWAAARDYSTSESYVGQEFPVVANEESKATWSCLALVPPQVLV